MSKQIVKTNNIKNNKIKQKSPFTLKRNQFLIEQAKKSENECLQSLNTTTEGLKINEIEERREKYGYNAISTKKQDTWWMLLFSAFSNPFCIILSIIACLSILVPVASAEKIDISDWISFGIITAMILISGFMRFFQEGRSSKASEKLKQMIKTTIAVKRNGIFKEISIEEILPGDIISLAAGDMIPADMRIISAKDLFITQSSLTGESEPVEKLSTLIANNVTSALECSNLCFMGTSVSSGTAIGVVLSIGNETYFGSIAKALTRKREKTAFDKGILSVSWIIIWTMIALSITIFIIIGAQNNSQSGWLNALTYSLAVAVGLTPEMLPMIVTLNLAKEAFKLSKQKTIVKKLNSIQSFGAMDVLCTDKTGTLTEDKIILERNINLEGDEDLKVLKYAYLNSFYQTGLKNLIDIAVIDKAKSKGIDKPISGFTKIDEIPFDFQRKRMSVIVNGKETGEQLVTKGAFEEIIQICSHCEYKGQVVPLSKELIEQAKSIVSQLNADGMRVIAICINKNSLPKDHPFSIADEKDMCLIGFIALLDPPKPSAKLAIQGLVKKGVMVKVLTGDNETVTKYVCDMVGIESNTILLGSDIINMSDEELKNKVMDVNIFAKLSPDQKARIITAIKSNKHIVGFMGDGINDAAAMKASDIGISVDTAADIAKESADIVLLEKDLTILEKGVVEGRKTFCNIMKYIKITISSNFGNMFSLLFAAMFLNGLEPMLPTQILILNMTYDFSQYMSPWDNVDPEYYMQPRAWNPKSIFKFMLCIGPISSIFDISSFLIMYYSFGWGQNNNPDTTLLFQTGWFFESLLTQVMVIYVLRTPKIPFIQSSPSFKVNSALIMVILAGTILVLVPGLETANLFSSLASRNVDPMAPFWILYAILLVVAYVITSQLGKVAYKKIFREWI